MLTHRYGFATFTFTSHLKYSKEKLQEDDCYKRQIHEVYSSSNKKNLMIQWALFNQTKAYTSEVCTRYRRTAAQNWVNLWRQLHRVL